MLVSMIVAMAKNRVIGRDNALPWRISRDLKRFRKLTVNKTIVMGRTTFESIGKVLDKRHSVVLTRNKSWSPESCPEFCAEHSDRLTILHSLDECFSWAHSKKLEEIVIIGGTQIYRQFMPYTSKLMLTEIMQEVAGDSFFPEIEVADWTVTEEARFPATEKTPYDYRFLRLERSSPSKLP